MINVCVASGKISQCSIMHHDLCCLSYLSVAYCATASVRLCGNGYSISKLFISLYFCFKYPSFVPVLPHPFTDMAIKQHFYS